MNSAASCNLVGQRGRGCRNLDLILLLGVVTYCSQLSLANPCTKCYECVRIGRLTQYVLNYHTHVNSGCYDRTKLEKCKIQGQKLWVATNLRKGGLGVGSVSCPRGEQNICFSQTGMWSYSDGGGVQDQYKEELVKSATQELKRRQEKQKVVQKSSDWYEKKSGKKTRDYNYQQ